MIVNAAIRRLVVYGFPLVFVIIEYLIRMALANQHLPAEPHGFMPATLASAGIGQLFPVVALKDRTRLLPKRVRNQMKAKGLSATGKADQAVSSTAWILIFLLTIVWAALLYASIQTQTDPDTLLYGLKTFYLGLVTYFVGVALAEAKEWV